MRNVDLKISMSLYRPVKGKPCSKANCAPHHTSAG